MLYFKGAVCAVIVGILLLSAGSAQAVPYNYRDTYGPVTDPVWDESTGTFDWLLESENAFRGWESGGLNPGWTYHIWGNGSLYYGFDTLLDDCDATEITVTFRVIGSYDGAWSPEELGDSWMTASWGYDPAIGHTDQDAVPMTVSHTTGSSYYSYSIPIDSDAGWAYLRIRNTSSDWIGMTWSGTTMTPAAVPEPASMTAFLVLGVSAFVTRKFVRKAK